MGRPIQPHRRQQGLSGWLLIVALLGLGVCGCHAFLLPTPTARSTSRRHSPTQSPPPSLVALAARKNPATSSGGSGKRPQRQRSIEEVGSATLKLGRVDFPPTPDTQFPASVDYLLTLEDVGLALPGLAPEEGKRYSFTLDTTASVNLITKEAADEVKAAATTAAAVAGGRGGGGGFGKKAKGFGKVKEEEEESNKSPVAGVPSEMGLEVELPSEPGIYLPTKALVAEEWGGVGAGCLGLPFLRSFGSIRIDLRTLKATVESTKGPSVMSSVEEFQQTQSGEPVKAWQVDFAPLRIKLGGEEKLKLDPDAYSDGDEEDEEDDDGDDGPGRPEVWVVDAHLDGSKESIPAIVDLGCQSSILNWRAARALGYRKGGKKTDGAKPVEGRVVTPESAGEGEGGNDLGIEVCFAEETRIALGEDARVEVPARRMAIADLPVFEYAGLHQIPAMVLGLDILGAACDDLILDWEGRRLTLAGPLLPIKRALASLELPLVPVDSTRFATAAYTPPFGLPRQYGVPAVVGGLNELLLMVDTAAGGSVLTREAFEAAKENGGEAGVKVLGGEGEGTATTVDLTGTGGGGEGKGVPAFRAAVPMYLGGSEYREGRQSVLEAAVVGALGSHAAFDGILGQDVMGRFPLVDWDLRHGMLRLYDEAALATNHDDPNTPDTIPWDGLLDYWPLPGKGAQLGAARLSVGVGEGVVGPNRFLGVEVVVNGREDVPILGLLDTGAQASVLNEAAAKALGLADKLQSCPITAQGFDGQPIPLKHTTVSGLHFQPTANDQQPITLVGPGSGRPSSIALAVGDLPGLARLGLLDRPAMLVGMDLLDGDRGGRLILDAKGGRLFIT